MIANQSYTTQRIFFTSQPPIFSCSIRLFLLLLPPPLLSQDVTARLKFLIVIPLLPQAELLDRAKTDRLDTLQDEALRVDCRSRFKQRRNHKIQLRSLFDCSHTTQPFSLPFEFALSCLFSKPLRTKQYGGKDRAFDAQRHFYSTVSI